ncbi:MAG: anti-sigma factor antagonist [Chitinivibrionales bacterium]|nr:anti-sigma factor antagonist [Chitinivibrionales bacterium]
MSVDIRVGNENGVPILSLNGRVRGEGDEKLGRELEVVLDQKSDKVIVDVSNAEYIDSHGLGVIIYYHKILQNKNRQLIILNKNTDPESYMARLIEITNLDKVLKVVASLEKVT